MAYSILTFYPVLLLFTVLSSVHRDDERHNIVFQGAYTVGSGGNGVLELVSTSSQVLSIKVAGILMVGC